MEYLPPHRSRRRARGGVARSAWSAALWIFIACLVAAGARPASAEERAVTGTIERIDAAARTLSVRDGMGVVWNYRVDRGAGIPLADFAPGDRVTVSLRRATPLLPSGPESTSRW